MTEKLYWRLEERFGQKEDMEKYVISFEKELEWDKNKNSRYIEEMGYKVVVDDIVSRVNVYVYNRDLPKESWIYSSSAKKHIVSAYEVPGSLEGASEDAIAAYKKFVGDLYDQGEPMAMSALGWGYFEGNAAYKRNLFLAKQYLSELWHKTGDAFAANALGYICYYGFANNGTPEYSEAFRYFSFGAMAGIDESIYRAADMLIHGKGIVKNIDVGLNMLVDGYRASMNEFCDGDYGNSLPEYALRMGAACQEGLIYGMNTRDAYKFLLEARFAIRKRREIAAADNGSENENIKKHPEYRSRSDESAENRIEYEIRRILEQVNLDQNAVSIRTDFPLYINQLFEDRYPLRITLKMNKRGNAGTLTIERYRFGKELAGLGLRNDVPDAPAIFDVPEILVAFPELSYAEMVHSLTYKLVNVDVAQKKDKGNTFFADGFRKNEQTNALEFFLSGNMVAAIAAQWFEIDIIREDTGKNGENGQQKV